MIPSFSIGPRTLLNDCNHSATAIFLEVSNTCRWSTINRKRVGSQNDDGRSALAVDQAWLHWGPRTRGPM